jgi:glc operon protein GlcG
LKGSNSNLGVLKTRGLAQDLTEPGVSTAAFHERLAQDAMPASYFADPMLTGLPGGAVIRSQSGATIGGVGISGLAPAEDQQFADAAAAASMTRQD